MSSVALIPVPDVHSTKSRISSNNLYVSLHRQRQGYPHPGEKEPFLSAKVSPLAEKEYLH